MITKTSLIQLRVTAAEKKLIRHAAQLNGLPMSAYIRVAVLNANLRALIDEQKTKKRSK